MIDTDRKGLFRTYIDALVTAETIGPEGAFPEYIGHGFTGCPPDTDHAGSALFIVQVHPKERYLFRPVGKESDRAYEVAERTVVFEGQKYRQYQRQVMKYPC